MAGIKIFFDPQFSFPFTTSVSADAVSLMPQDQCEGIFPDTRIVVEGIQADDNRLKKVGWLGAHVHSSVPWPTSPHLVHFRGVELFLLPAEKDLLPAIFVRVRGACKGEHREPILRFLSIWSWIEGYGIRVENWNGGSRPFRSKGQGGRSISNFPLNFDFWPKNLSRDAEIALALYREAKSLKHAPYSMLSYLKIINLLEPGTNGQRKVIARYLPEITEKRASERLNELGSNPDHRSLPDYILEACRHAVAHANLSKKYSFDPDNPADELRLAKDEPIIQSLASLVIRREFGVPSRRDNWKSKTHYIAGVIWWIGQETYKLVLSQRSIGRRALHLPSRVNIMVQNKSQKSCLTKLRLRTECVDGGIASMGLMSDDGLSYFEVAIDFNIGRLMFDPLAEHKSLDDGSIEAAERAKDINEFWGEVVGNGCCQLWDSETGQLLAEADAYIPNNWFMDFEAHRKKTEELQLTVDARREADIHYDE